MATTALALVLFVPTVSGVPLLRRHIGRHSGTDAGVVQMQTASAKNCQQSPSQWINFDRMLQSAVTNASVMPERDDPSPELSPALTKMLKDGVLIIGDSTARRLFVRLVARSKRFTEYLSELMQKHAWWANPSADDLIAYKGLLSKSELQDVVVKYDVSLAYGRIRHHIDNHFDIKTLLQSIQAAIDDGFHHILIGLPVGHLSIDKYWTLQPEVCRDGWQGVDARMRAQVNLLSGLHPSNVEKNDSNISFQVTVLSGVPWAYDNGCRWPTDCPGWPELHGSRRDESINFGFEHMNRVVKEAASDCAYKVGRKVRFLDIHDLTRSFLQTRPDREELFDGNPLHYHWRVLDAQLEAIASSAAN